MPECAGGCLCDDCCAAARRFAIAHWHLDDFRDYEAGSDDLWMDIGEGPEYGRVRRVVLFV